MSERSKEVLDQEWGELVEEHRLAMPGVQVLFAFLLILPFQSRFDRLSDQQKYVYFCGAPLRDGRDRAADHADRGASDPLAASVTRKRCS